MREKNLEENEENKIKNSLKMKIWIVDFLNVFFYLNF